MQETYLVKLKDDSTEKDFMMTTFFLKQGMSQIIMASVQKRWLIVALNRQIADSIKRLPFVKGVSGVTFRKRDIKVIRINTH